MGIARHIVLALLVVAGLAAAPARATVISAGSYDFNLDFTPAPSYSWANVQFVINTVAAGAHFSVTFFPDPDEGGTPLGPSGIIGPVNAPTTVTVGVKTPEFLDGLFSVRFTLDTGTADISNAFAFISDTFAGAPIASIPLSFQPTVPEPATLLLVGLGLAALRVARRRA